MCSLHDDTEQGCEHCQRQFPIEIMSTSGDGCWLCPGCVAEFRKVFDACEHDWEPHVDHMGDEGRVCKRCSGFVLKEAQP
jgi:hypothetical protein